MKTVWITGATRGLGRAMTVKFIERGWTVAGCGRSGAAVTELAAGHGSPHFFRTADMAVEESVRRFAEEAIASVGAPDLLLNNAAVITPNAPLWEVDAEAFASIVEVNIKGVASMIRHTVPAMIARGTGIIINFSSGWGRSTSPEVAPYCATKWAIEGMTAALAQELPRGLAAAALNPGVINTEMLQSCFGSAASAHPTADEWAVTAVPFLAALDERCNGRQLTAP